MLRHTREALAGNFDQNDPNFITLKEELQRLFKQKKLSEVTQEEMNRNIGTLRRIYEKVKELNRLNSRLREKYRNDKKFARIHKRIKEAGKISIQEGRIHQALLGIKTDADNQVLQNTRLLDNENYFNSMMAKLVIDQFEAINKIQLNADAVQYISRLAVNEYIDEFNGHVA